MSEQKSKYVPGTVYTQQFACTLPEGWGDVSEETITPIPSSLPTLLAQMVTEFQVGLGSQSEEVHARLAEHFTVCLLAAAQPTLAKYFDQLANPPMVVKQSTPADYLRTEEAMEMARTGNKEAARKHLGLDGPEPAPVVTDDNPYQQGKVAALIDALNKNERECERIHSGKL